MATVLVFTIVIFIEFLGLCYVPAVVCGRRWYTIHFAGFILLRCFGHRFLQTTSGYFLNDKGFAEGIYLPKQFRYFLYSSGTAMHLKCFSCRYAFQRRCFNFIAPLIHSAWIYFSKLCLVGRWAFYFHELSRRKTHNNGPQLREFVWFHNFISKKGEREVCGQCLYLSWGVVKWVKNSRVPTVYLPTYNRKGGCSTGWTNIIFMIYLAWLVLRMAVVSCRRKEQAISATNRWVLDSFDLTWIYPRRGSLYLHSAVAHFVLTQSINYKHPQRGNRFVRLLFLSSFSCSPVSVTVSDTDTTLKCAPSLN